MRKFPFIVLSVILATGWSPPAYALDVPLKYEKYTTESAFFPSGYGDYMANEKQPSGAGKMPVFSAKKPLYVSFPLGDRNCLAVLDMREPGAKHYSRLWLDCNCNGDLADEKPVDGAVSEESSGSYDVRFSALDMTITVEGTKLPYRIQPMIQTRGIFSNSEKMLALDYVVHCAYRGNFTLDGVNYTFWVEDSNGNGRFTDYGKVQTPSSLDTRRALYCEGDMVYVTDEREIRQSDSRYLGEYLLLGSRVFRVKIDNIRQLLTLAEIKNGLTPVALSMIPERLSLYSKESGVVITVIKPSGNTISLPPGKYHLFSYLTYKRDDQDDLWRIIAGGTKDSPELVPGPGAMLSIGEPFTPMANLPVNLREPSTMVNLRLSLSVEGQGKEVITELIRMEGTATRIPLSKTRGRENYPLEASYSIVKPDGEIVARGSFEYG
jgi:hypothetical protein